MDTSFFILSKVVQFCIEPLNWVLLFVVLSLLFLALRKPRLCKWFLLLTSFDLLVVGWIPTSEVFLRALEDQVPQVDISKLNSADLGGIIILGGAVEGGKIASDRGEISINSKAERVTKALELIRQHPDLPFIFSGFSGRVFPQGISEAAAFQQLIAQQGLTTSLGHYENQSRNTYENVLFIRPMASQLGEKKPDGSLKPWLLITSASHMYRAQRIFQKQEIAVIPVAVDYQTAKSLRWANFDLEIGMQNWNRLNHELLGLLAYWITGKI
jgi:uncharacterized SAM-binding protein YcdF (DUF218 family)